MRTIPRAAELAVESREMIHRIATHQEILPLRASVLRPGLALKDAVFVGDEDPTTCHFGTFERDRIVGCLTMMRIPRDGRAAWQLRGMAVEQARRGAGVGRALLDFACLAIESAQEIQLVWCNARTEAVGFYQKQGWTVISGEFMIPGVGPHFRMSRKLGHSPEVSA